MSERQDTLQQYVSDMLALERHLLPAIENQSEDDRMANYPETQGMEFLNGSFIHYGLGNLFFDQLGICEACSQGLIDHHIFYDGRYISTELYPIQFVDYARSRPMTSDEANDLLRALFLASGWQQ